MHKRFTLAIVAILMVCAACAGKTEARNNKPDAPAKSTLAPRITAEGVTFSFKPKKDTPAKVFLAGSFNGWKPDSPAHALEDLDGDGIWTITIKLDPGSYEYKFVADGTWLTDPHAPKFKPDPYGGKNAVVEVP